MFSFISVNAGYGANLIPNPNSTVQPFFGTSGPTINVSALIALKESYWGIPIMAGYCAPGLAVSKYAAVNSDTLFNASYKGGSAGHYNIYYLFSGLNLKAPGYTTRNAIELRVMVGPLIASMPAITYNNQIPVVITNPNTCKTITTRVSPSTVTSIGLSPGIGAGYKIAKHLAIMGYCDAIFAVFPFDISTANTSNGTVESQNFRKNSAMSYINLTAALAYSFGTIAPNIAY